MTSDQDRPCSRPGGTDRDPLFETTETAASYDQVAAQFAARWCHLRLERALDTFTRYLTGQRRVLDLGCGPGRDAGFLGQLGCQVAGLDLSAGMLAEARQRLPGTPLICADQRHLPLAPGSFDGVWACASLLHLPRAEFPSTLAQVSRLLRRPGGILHLAMKVGQGERWVTDEAGHRYFFAYYSPSEIETALALAGFQVLETWISPNQAGQREPWINAVSRVESS